MELRPLRKGFFSRHVLIALLGLSIVYFLQAEQAECLGVVRKSEISGMTRRLRRLKPLAPEAVHRRFSPGHNCCLIRGPLQLGSWPSGQAESADVDRYRVFR